MNRASQLKKMLEELGANPDEVAETLRAHGIQGVRNAVRTLNPIVRYLQHRLRIDALSLDVIQADRVRMVFGNGSTEEASLPRPVRQFLEAFNREEYPELHLLSE